MLPPLLPFPTPAPVTQGKPQLTRTSNLSPGGVIELQDIIYPMASDDGSLTETSSLKRWGVLLNEAFRGIGRPMDTAFAYETQLREAGFVDVQVVQEKWPTNRWPRDKKYKQMGTAPSLFFPRRSFKTSRHHDSAAFSHGCCHL